MLSRLPKWILRSWTCLLVVLSKRFYWHRSWLSQAKLIWKGCGTYNITRMFGGKPCWLWLIRSFVLSCLQKWLLCRWLLRLLPYMPIWIRRYWSVLLKRLLWKRRWKSDVMFKWINRASLPLLHRMQFWIRWKRTSLLGTMPLRHVCLWRCFMCWQHW